MTTPAPGPPYRGSQLAHAIVSAPSQWGQQACDHLLRRITVDGGQITLIVPRKDQELFESAPPTIPGWSTSASVKAHLDQRRREGWPVDYVYDDQLNHLRELLICQRALGNYLIAGYVTSDAEYHYDHAKLLSGLCDRVLIEKPISKFPDDIRSSGRFMELDRTLREAGECPLMCADHYLFRPGVTQVWNPTQAGDAEERRTRDLLEFLQRHRECNLHYEFTFEEPAKRDDPERRLGAYQDGSILDVLVVHGLGPIVRLLLPAAVDKPDDVDLCRDFVPRELRAWQAIDPQDQSLRLPVLSESAAFVAGKLKFPDGRHVEIALRSAKGAAGYLRYFKFECPTCRLLGDGAPGAPASSPRFAVSLGSDGFTMLDYLPEGETSRSEAGGFRSDTLGGNTQAANAQAAMLDVFLGHDFERDRFITVKAACELARLGMALQGRTFLQERPTYAWERGPTWPDRADNVADFEIDSGQRAGLAELTWALGIEGKKLNAAAPHRIITIVGPEGFGNTTVARELRKKLEASLDRGVLRVDVPRSEDWGTEPGSIGENPLVLNMVLDQLSGALGVVLRPGWKRPKGVVEQLREVILINGIDRLASPEYAALIRALSELPVGCRLILITNRTDQACGFVMRTRDMMHPDALNAPSVTRHFDRRIDQLLKNDLREENRKRVWSAYKEICDLVLSFARSNRTVAYQAMAYLIFIILPEEIRARAAEEGVDWREVLVGQTDALLEHAKLELQSLTIPEALIPNSVEMLERISLLCLDRVPERELEAVRRLAVVSGDLPAKVIEGAMPRLLERLLTEFAPVRSLFERVDREEGGFLFARVRRAVLDPDLKGRRDEVRGQVERRRLMVSFLRLRDQTRDRQLDERMVHLVQGTSLHELNLDGGVFEDYCIGLLQPLEVSVNMGGAAEALWLVDHLTGESVTHRTNLGLIPRARLRRLKGLLALRAAGVDAVRLFDAARQLEMALHVAAFCVPESYAQGELTEDFAKRVETKLLAIQGVVLAALTRARAWHKLLDLDAAPPPADESWREYVEEGGELRELCGVGGRARAPTLSPAVRAIGLRTLAIAEGLSQAEDRSGAVALCEQAAELSAGAAEDLRVLCLMEAALLSRDRALLEAAAEALEQLETPPRELQLYLTFLRTMLNPDLTGTGQDLSELADQFRLSGALYFADLCEVARSARSPSS